MAGPADAALEAAAHVRVTVIVGAADTGKTTLTAHLASALAAQGQAAEARSLLAALLEEELDIEQRAAAQRLLESL